MRLVFRFNRGESVYMDLLTITERGDMSNEHESVHMSDPCHLGEVLPDWIRDHGKTIQESATLMGASRATLNQLLSGAGRIPPKAAVQLERMGWSSAEMWLRLQPAHGLAAARHTKQVARMSEPH